MSRVITLERLEAGMILGHDLSTQFGQLIARSGEEITPRLIRMMSSFGITEIEVTDSIEPEAEFPVSSEELQQAEEELKPWFQFTNRQDPLVDELFKVCSHRRARHVQGHPIRQVV